MAIESAQYLFVTRTPDAVDFARIARECKAPIADVEIRPTADDGRPLRVLLVTAGPRGAAQ